MNDLKQRIAGSRFRPVHWSDIGKPGAPIVGWGLEQKAAGQRRYKPVGWNGQVHPFDSKKEAQTKCDELNDLAKEQQP